MKIKKKVRRPKPVRLNTMKVAINQMANLAPDECEVIMGPSRKCADDLATGVNGRRNRRRAVKRSVYHCSICHGWHIGNHKKKVLVHSKESVE